MQATVKSDLSTPITLGELMKENGGKLLELDALHIGHGAAQKLTALHRRNKIHGRLHPAVIRLWGVPAERSEREVEVLEGVAAGLPGPYAASGAWQARPDAAEPQLLYMAPEWNMANAGVDGKADVYSLAGVLYHVLTGRAPFEARTVEELIESHLVKVPRPIRKRAAEVTAEVEALLGQMLAKSPAVRPTMEQVTSELGRLLTRRQVKTVATMDADSRSARQAPDLLRSAAHGAATERIAERPSARATLTEPAIAPTLIAPAASDSLKPGARCGKYRIEQRIGSGGMAEVFEATHAQTRQRVAIKVPLAQMARQASFAARFLGEARAMAQLHLAGVAEIYDFDQLSDGTPYIVMEYIAGQTLRARLQERHRLPQATACEIVRQLALTLVVTHDRNIIHRDLKPDNIMLMEAPEMPGGERVKILDFGIAKLSVEVKHTLALSAQTGPGARLGTVEYMAPEQWQDPSSVDGRADVYALGVLLYELLHGRTPFAGADVMSKMRRNHGSPPPLVQGAPPALAHLMIQMLSVDAALRPTMAKVAEAIRPFAASASRPAARRLSLLMASGVGAATVLSAFALGQQLLSQPVQWAIETSPPGAAVRVAARTMPEKTPYRIIPSRDLPEESASTEVRLELPGYVTRTLTADPKRAENFKLTLEPQQWTLTSEPSGANVLGPSGQTLGKTPWKLQPDPLHDQDFQVTVSLPGQTPRNLTFKPRLGANQHYHVQLLSDAN